MSLKSLMIVCDEPCESINKMAIMQIFIEDSQERERES